MENASKTRTERVLKILLVLTWIVFIGLMVQAGAILFSYGFTLINPDGARNLYKGLDLSGIREADFLQFNIAALLLIALPAMKAYIAYLAIQVMGKVNLQNPFSLYVVRKLESMSYDIVVIWVVSVLQTAHNAWLVKPETPLEAEGSGETLFMAGLVYVIAQVFKRGVELQSESDLTV